MFRLENAGGIFSYDSELKGAGGRVGEPSARAPLRPKAYDLDFGGEAKNFDGSGGFGVEDLFELSLQFILQGKRVQTVVAFAQLPALLELQDAGPAKSLIRRSRQFVAFAPMTALAP